MALPRFATAVLLSALAAAPSAWAFEVDLVPSNPRTLYLRVGSAGDVINRVETTLSPGNIGNGVSQPMLPTSGGATASELDGGPACSVGQVYVAGYYRTASQGQPFGDPARMSVLAPPTLVGAGGSIPISQISWTTSHARNPASPVPATGTFSGGSQVFGSIVRNRWFETCMSFSYANQQIVPGGSYDARVTFTLTQP